MNPSDEIRKIANSLRKAGLPLYWDIDDRTLDQLTGMAAESSGSDNWEDVEADEADRFCSCWITKEVRTSMKRLFKSINEKGGMADAWGRWITLEDERLPRHVLATVAQGHELHVLQTIGFTIDSLEGISLAAWFHDGFLLARDEGLSDRAWAAGLNQIQSYVHQRAVDLGLPYLRLIAKS